MIYISTQVIVITFFLSTTAASCFWNAFGGCSGVSKASVENDIDLNRDLRAVLTTPDTKLNRTTLALLRCMVKKDDPICHAFNEFFFSEYKFESLLFYNFSPQEQESVINSVFADFLCNEENREAAKIIVEREVLPAYPLFLGNYTEFDVDTFFDYKNERYDHTLTAYVDKRVLLSFNEQMSAISASTYQAQYMERVAVLVDKAQASVSSKISGINHDFNVFKKIHVDLIGEIYNACSHISDSLENYIHCFSNSIHDRVFEYLRSAEIPRDELLDELAREIFFSSSEFGIKEIIECFMSLKLDSKDRGIIDSALIYKATLAASQNGHLDIFSLLEN